MKTLVTAEGDDYYLISPVEYDPGMSDTIAKTVRDSAAIQQQGDRL